MGFQGEEEIFQFLKKEFPNCDVVKSYTGIKLDKLPTGEYRQCEIDVYIKKLKIAIEIDTYASHKNKFLQDKRKNIRLNSLNIDVIRIREPSLRKTHWGDMYAHFPFNEFVFSELRRKINGILKSRAKKDL